MGDLGSSVLDGYITKSQFAQMFGKTARTIDRWALTGDGPPRVQIGRVVLYSRTSVEAWLKSREKQRRGRASRRAGSNGQ